MKIESFREYKILYFPKSFARRNGNFSEIQISKNSEETSCSKDD